ncbi:PaaI family thioesterase [Nocardioides nitrophenolicus]|uniref:PaaI family thioesterase n=1 Tax=Nocardioides nitrophenolicus TaxID=60489 RepID=UPI00195D1FF0|nr:hypothetical protein [Nocardioides nitrophenolicus]MBM7517973.1 acyl-coenzyme A thioesterase PaaI-like protein [Nocardioides nitrophenolicus]
MQQLRFLGSGPEDLFEVSGLRQCSDGVGGLMTLGAWGRGADGRLAVGALGVLADEVLGYALMASLPQDEWSISTEIWLDVVSELPGPGVDLVGHATPVQTGAFSTGEIRDGRGRLLVSCRQRGRSVSRPDEDAVAAAPSVAPAAADGIEAVLGLRAAADGWVLDARPELANPKGMLHGGISLAASEAVATRARVDRGSSLRTTSVHIVHTRGIPAGASVVFDVEHRHAGRTLWVTHVVGRVDGKVGTVATITAG